MSSKKTTHYKLHQWEPSDHFLRTEFNDNFTALDTALGAEVSARGSAVSSLNTALGKKPEIVTGTYTGDGTKNRTMALGFQPRAVLVVPEDGRLSATYCYYGGLALTGAPVTARTYEMIALTANGFRVSHTYISHNNYSEYVTANESGQVYHYLAVK